MKLLVLGGTVFVGRHLVEAAVVRGHDVTLFNRGRHGAELFPHVEKLRGDRETDLAALYGRQWDAVLDTCGNLPHVVGMSAELLANNIGHYTFVSSVSAYREFPGRGGLDESAGLAPMLSDSQQPNESNFGAFKAACERVVERSFPGRALLLRAGFIVGPHDPTRRFAYWPLRVAEGGEVLAPGDPDAPVQLIDVRDVATWTLGAIERGLTGAYNVTGREHVMTMAELLDVCRRECGCCTFTWLNDDFLLSNGLMPRRDLPLWSPHAAGAALVDTTKARAAGLSCQDIAATVHDTFVWTTLHAGGPRPRNWLSKERERELLTAWHNAQRPLAGIA